MDFKTLILVVLFWFGVVGAIYLLKKLRANTPINIHYGLLLMIREKETIQSFLQYFLKLVKPIPDKLLSVLVISVFLLSMFLIIPVPLSLIGIPIWGFPSMIHVFLNNLKVILQHLQHELEPQQFIQHGFLPLQPIIPGVTTSLMTFIYIIIAISIGVVFHEIAHGVLALKYGSKIKSGGFFALMFIAFGGFVELDEEDLKRISMWKRLTVYSAGVFTNILIVYIVCLIYVLISNSPLLYTLLGVKVIDPQNSLITTSSIITAINGIKVSSTYDLISKLVTLAQHSEVINLQLYDTLRNLEYVVTIGVPKYVKIYSIFTFEVDGIGIISDTWFYQLLFWIFNINITLALLNALPAYPLDGGHVLDNILQFFKIKEIIRKQLMYMASIFVWSMIGLTLYYTLTYGLYVSA